MTPDAVVPRALRSWFIAHCIIDVLFAVPLIFIPDLFLGLFAWREIDLSMSRLVGAALLGIGIQSFLGRDESRETFRAMLGLKIIWSAAATLGIAASVLQGRTPVAGWLFAAVFAVFLGVWTFWRVRLDRT